jgi:hypothetical protein
LSIHSFSSSNGGMKPNCDPPTPPIHPSIHPSFPIESLL